MSQKSKPSPDKFQGEGTGSFREEDNYFWFSPELKDWQHGKAYQAI